LKGDYPRQIGVAFSAPASLNKKGEIRDFALSINQPISIAPRTHYQG